MTKAGRKTIAAGLVAFTITSGSALAAGAKKLPQSGPVDQDSGASVELVVLKKDGAPKSVKGIKIKDLLADCDVGERRITLKLFGAAKVEDGVIGRDYGSDDQTLIRIKGTVAANGKSVSAQIKGAKDSAVPISGAGNCAIPKFTFTTSR